MTIFTGNDTVYAKGGNDFINGSYGADYIDGGAGYDIVSYDFYDDGINANLTTGIVRFPGNSTQIDTLVSIERLTGSRGNDKLYGNSEANDLYGHQGNDILYGGSGDDILEGGSGNDYLNGYGGSSDIDVLYGGPSYDIFALGDSKGSYYQGSGHAIIADFQPGYDKIELHGSSESYKAEYGYWIGTSAADTQILYNGNVIGYVVDIPQLQARDISWV